MHSLTHTHTQSCIIHNRRMQQSSDAPSAPAFILNVSNKNDSLPVIYIGALLKSLAGVRSWLSVRAILAPQRHQLCWWGSQLWLKAATVECAVCAPTIVFPFNGCGWCTGDGVGTFVHGPLTVSWVGLDFYGMCVRILLCFSLPTAPLLFISSANGRVGLC